jgi:ParB family chromosome partitioning protein
MKRLEFRYLTLDKIDVSISNVRKAKLEEGLDDLAKSIEEIGVQQPIVVSEKPDGRFDLIIGQRRYLASHRVEGLKTIPALITTVKNETEAVIISFSENIHRLDLEYRDKMRVATELLSKLGSTRKVAERLGVTPQTVRNYLGYAAVPEEIKRMVDKGDLRPSTATRIAKSIPDEKQAVRIAEKIKEIPRSEDKRMIIDLAKENPDKSLEEIDELAEERKFEEVTINVTPRIADALDQACKRYESDPEIITAEALEEWLRRRGFVE